MVSMISCYADHICCKGGMQEGLPHLALLPQRCLSVLHLTGGCCSTDKALICVTRPCYPRMPAPQTAAATEQARCRARTSCSAQVLRHLSLQMRFHLCCRLQLLQSRHGRMLSQKQDLFGSS